MALDAFAKAPTNGIVSPVEPNRFRDHSIWVWVGGAVLLVLLVAGVIGARPLWERSKQWRAEKFLRQYYEDDAAGRAESAAGDLAAAFMLAPTYRPVVLEVARFYSKGQSAEALGLWRDLDARSPLSPEERLVFARTALELDRFDIALPQATRLMKEAPDLPGLLPLAADVSQRRGNLEEAISFADQALTRDPANVTNQLRLASLELLHSDSDIGERGKQRLLSMSTGGGPGRTVALQQLLLTRRLDPSDARLLLRLNAAVPDSPVERLIRLQLENLRDPEHREERVVALARPLWNPAGRPELTSIVSWLSQVGAYEDILLAVPSAEATADTRLFLFRISALAELDRWPDVEALLNNPSAPDAPLVQAILRASGAHSAGKTNESIEYWKQALSLSGNERILLQSIARQAERRGYLGVALEAWRGLLGDPKLAPRAASEILRISSSERNLAVRREALRRLDQLRMLPPAQRVDLALYEALLNPDITRARQILKRAGPKSGETELCAVTAALIALKENDPESASHELDALNLDWTKAPLLWQVVRIAQLGRTGRRTEVRAFVERLPVSTLSAPERELISAWLPER